MEKEIKFNINHYVKAKITEHGYSVWADSYNKYSTKPLNTESIIKLRNRADKDGYTSFQMHNFMNVFGENTGMGSKMCFDTNIIIMPE
tara:strand:+ start:336 stop:599 length:264 start_codon:yes stop_codon:yes gene_type:complete